MQRRTRLKGDLKVPDFEEVIVEPETNRSAKYYDAVMMGLQQRRVESVKACRELK